MRCSCGLIALLLFACNGTPDPIVGTWTFGTKAVELREDGTIIAEPRSEPECEREQDALAACARKHRWAKQGSRYRITMMTLARPRGTGGMGSMFDTRAGSGCQCVEDVVGVAELHGDELVVDGKERGTRLKR